MEVVSYERVDPTDGFEAVDEYTTDMVTASSLACLRGFVLLGLASQLSTLLLTLAGLVPPRP